MARVSDDCRIEHQHTKHDSLCCDNYTFVVDGNGPLCHLRAARSLTPAAAAAAASVLPAIRFSRNRRTCASVTHPSSSPERETLVVECGAADSCDTCAGTAAT